MKIARPSVAESAFCDMCSESIRISELIATPFSDVFKSISQQKCKQIMDTLYGNGGFQDCSGIFHAFLLFSNEVGRNQCKYVTVHDF